MHSPTVKQIEVLKTVAEWADRFPCIRKIYVFGSFARGVEMPDDVDIAVDYIEDVTKTALRCYTDVNVCSGDLEQSLSGIVSVRVGWTGLVLADGYDQKAWMGDSCGKGGLLLREGTDDLDGAKVAASWRLNCRQRRDSDRGPSRATPGGRGAFARPPRRRLWFGPASPPGSRGAVL